MTDVSLLRSFCGALLFFKQKTAYEVRISDWSSDGCSSDLGVLARRDAVPGRLDADDPHLGVVEEGVEQAHRVRAAADAGDQRIRQPVLRRQARKSVV